MPVYTRISTSPLDLQKAYDFVCDPAHGAVDMFVGVVRNHHEGQAVKGITYDVHEALAQTVFQEICAEALAKWPRARLYLSHYKGYLDVGGISVLIAASAAHRAEAFDSCRFIIETLKKRAPVWKQEHYETGDSAWLPGHSLAEDF